MSAIDPPLKNLRPPRWLFTPRSALLCAAILCVCACTPSGQGDIAASPAAPAQAMPAPAPPPPPAAARELPDDASSLPAEDRDYLVARGLAQPEAELIADLRAHPELIDCQGALGGTPRFNDPEAIHIVARDHAQARFDDGHQQGDVDLSFTVRGGKIAWKVKSIECGGDARVANAGKP